MEISTVAQSQESQEDNSKDCKLTHLEIVKTVKEASGIKLSVIRLLFHLSFGSRV